MKVLFVCLGNICRSPTAEAVLRQKLEQQSIHSVEVDSAGTAGYHIGNPPDERAIAAGKAKGYALSSLSARQLSVEDFNEFDLILAMDEANLRDIHHIQPKGSLATVAMASSFSEQSFINVADPYYGDAQGFYDVIQQCESIALGIIEHYKQDASR